MLQSSVTLPLVSVKKIRIQIDTVQVKMDEQNPDFMSRQHWLMLDLVTLNNKLIKMYKMKLEIPFPMHTAIYAHGEDGKMVGHCRIY
jgi:hypothetical protein